MCAASLVSEPSLRYHTAMHNCYHVLYAKSDMFTLCVEWLSNAHNLDIHTGEMSHNVQLLLEDIRLSLYHIRGNITSKMNDARLEIGTGTNLRSILKVVWFMYMVRVRARTDLIDPLHVTQQFVDDHVGLVCMNSEDFSQVTTGFNLIGRSMSTLIERSQPAQQFPRYNPMLSQKVKEARKLVDSDGSDDSVCSDD